MSGSPPGFDRSHHRALPALAILIALAVSSGLAAAQQRPPVSENPYGEEPAPPPEAGQAAAPGTGSEAEEQLPVEEGATDGTEADTDAADHTPVWAREDETLPPPTTPTPPAPTTAPREGGAAGTATGIPIDFHLNGYFRTRAVWTGNTPVEATAAGSGPNGAATAAYTYMRLRLRPSLTYGSDEANPVVALYTEIDALDNVVFGDNARLARTPIFAGDPSVTDIEGFDVPSVQLNRAWLQFLIPVGQVRVGRMPSDWGHGILTTGGDGLGEWGDPNFGTTYDRILFATRPLTIYNALSRGDSRQTPLIFVVAYDKLVEDPLQDPAGALDDDPVDPATRSVTPFSFLSRGEEDVQEAVIALVWKDPELNPLRATDNLTAGLYYVHRWQTATDSYVHIGDAFWTLRYTLGPDLPSLYTAGEIVGIVGESRGISLATGCVAGGVCRDINANIWGAIVRAGAIDRDDRWAGHLEWGFSSGDGVLFDDGELSARPLHPDYHVGLLMYQVALASATATRLGEDLRPIWSRGGVWNSHYLWPQFRYTIIPGIEAHGAFMLAWARQLLSPVHASNRALGDTACGPFEGDCFLGWEADVALRFKWGENDLMRWDTELGFMNAGEALSSNGTGLGKSFLWTLQSRVGMVW